MAIIRGIQSIVLVVSVWCVSEALPRAAPQDDGDTAVIAATKTNCDPFNYCEGQKFPRTMEIQGRFVTCDQNPQLKKNCCLPNAYHYVCYDIKVEDYRLNFMARVTANSVQQKQSTILSELCDALLGNQGQSRGKYVGMLMGSGGGRQLYRYGQWSLLDTTPADDDARYIKHLACSTAKTKA